MWNKIQRIYVGSNLVRPIGWTPWSNTIAYRPLTSTTTLNDQSGNNYNLTNKGSVTFWTYKGVDCAYFSGTWNNYLDLSSFQTNQQTFTVLCWIYYISNGKTANGNYDQVAWWWYTNHWLRRDCYNSPYNKLVCGWVDAWSLTSDSSWIFTAYTFNGSNVWKFYKNGSLVGSYTNTPNFWSTFAIGGIHNCANNYKKWGGGISEVIVEKRQRTAQEIASYYNQTKSKYGL